MSDVTTELAMEASDKAMQIARLRAENAKLRDDRDGWKKVCVDQEVMHVMHEDALDNEIAELRELARHMRTCMEHYEVDGTISCDRCPLDNDTGNCDFERRMRELGVDA